MQIDNFEVKNYPAISSLGLSSSNQRLRVCIVTEEIIGPVRNGGIASTYYHLSKGLAAHGHDVHVLFLKGPVVQDETPEHWVEHFAGFGVTLHYLDIPGDPAWSSAPNWQSRYSAAYHWLRDQERFDVVHTSEWRGGTFYALMAKRLGLAFQDTLFLVKTSSPHIWNRHYQMQPIERRDLVLAAHAEQKCVELADAVIGGSAHLITFMEQIGYKIPDANVFVQPNIVDFSNVPVTDQRPGRQPGDIVNSSELIFFGRLEARKGVELMCNALDILRERQIAPSSVTFMGKWGGLLATQGGKKVQNYIEEKARNWDFPVSFVTDKNQPEALSHMCSRDMIAVMPSLIENSTMAVYETLECNIPFIATDVGGTAELIDQRDHVDCLVQPNSTALANRLEKVLEHGQRIARPGFSNDENLQVWYGFHAYLGEQIKRLGARQAICSITARADTRGLPIKALRYAVLLRSDDNVEALTQALLRDRPDSVALAYNDANLHSLVAEAKATLTDAGLEVLELARIGQAAGDTLHALTSLPGADAIVIAHGASVQPAPGFVAAVRTALEHRPNSLITSFFSAVKDVHGTPAGSDVASQFLSPRAYGPEIFAMRRATYEKVGRFEPYDVQRGILHEFVTRASVKFNDDLMVCPEPLLDWPQAMDESQAMADDSVYAYLKAKPLIDESGLAQRKILLSALHLVTGGNRTIGDKSLRDGGRPKESPLWLTPADWDRSEITDALKRKLVAGLDEETNTLWLYARGVGSRRLMTRDTTQQIELVDEHLSADGGDHITLHRYQVPASWEVGTTHALNWSVFDGERKAGNQFLRISKLAENTYALSSRKPLLTKDALRQIFLRQCEGASASTTSGSSAKPDPSPRVAKAPNNWPDSLTSAPQQVVHTSAPDTLGNAPAQVVDKLMRLADETDRPELQRLAMQKRSELLLAQMAPLHLDKKPFHHLSDVRSFLALPANGCWRENEWLQGWAWDRMRPNTLLHIIILQGTEPVYASPADFHDPTLGHRTPGLEQHAFRIPVLPSFFSPGNGTLSLRILETGDPVRNGHLAPGDVGSRVLKSVTEKVQPARTSPARHTKTSPLMMRARRMLKALGSRDHRTR
ncbi:glycosyltransferase family 4 protein [Ruegeria sp. 2012CJ41-6]|uniref:Glycosyltransferase family 4 protein n=1 Tax=Ruegeria spongiae TaxID=2942209 RepID=A0ABT0Q706_9RHOB|nr:glycosyltransferase family 4 protein [Ruegeria spongiae]MCL6285620.1 glycosyltransferase family 4 protein [Ruegeria spongiae]